MENPIEMDKSGFPHELEITLLKITTAVSIYRCFQ